MAIDSAPLEGAGRVEDALNLLAHAAHKVVDCAASLLGWRPERVCREARATLLLAPSVKAGLVDEALGRDGEVICRPWIARNKGTFPRAVFKINMRDLTIACPAGEVERIEFGSVPSSTRKPANIARCERSAPPRAQGLGAP